MPYTDIHLSFTDHCAELLIDRPHKRNALTEAMWRDLGDALAAVGRNPAVRLLVLRGAGGAFSAGADLDELRVIITDPARLAQNNAAVRQAQLALQGLPCMTLAAIEGACVGGGCGLALACDFRLALADAKFAITPARLGLLYGADDVRRVVNLVGSARARQLLLTGQAIDAETALAWGMLTELCAAGELEQRLDAWRATAQAVSPFSVRGIKRTIGMLDGSESADFPALERLFDAAFSHPEFAEGAQAFLERRAPRF